MSTLSNQFMQGAQFVRQNELDAQNQILRKEQNQRIDEQHALQQESGTLQNQVTAAKHKEWEGNAEKRATLADLQVSQTKAEAEDRNHNRERRTVIEGREDETYNKNKTRTSTLQGREDEQYERGKVVQNRADKQYERTQNLQWLKDNAQQAMYGLSTNGSLSPEFVRRMKGTSFDISQTIEPEYGQQLDFLAVALDPRDGRTNPKDPRFIHSMNTVFGADINKGLEDSVHPESGSPAVSKRIVNAYPVEGKAGDFYVELEVTYENGEKRTEPMTQGRGSDPDAELGVMNAGELVQQVSARKAYKDLIQKSGLAEKYKEYAAYQAKQKRAAKGDNYDQLTQWKGQTVKTSELANEYKMLPEVYREGDTEMGTAPYVSFNDFLWSSGDPQKLGLIDKVVKHNIKVDEYNRSTDDPKKQKVRVDILDAWAALDIDDTKPNPANGKANSGDAGATDPNKATLDAIIDEPSAVDPTKVPDIDGEPSPSDNPATEPTLERQRPPIRTPQGAMQSAYRRRAPEVEKEQVPIGEQLKSRRESRSQR